MRNIPCELTKTYWHLPYIKYFTFLNSIPKREPTPYLCNMIHRLLMNKLTHRLVKVILWFYVKSEITWNPHSNDWGEDDLWKFVGFEAWLKRTQIKLCLTDNIQIVFSVFFFFFNEKLENTVFCNAPLLNTFPTQIFQGFLFSELWTGLSGQAVYNIKCLTQILYPAERRCYS